MRKQKRRNKQRKWFKKS